MISQYWEDTGSWNSYSQKTRTHLSYIVNIMTADGLATQGARSPAAMVLIYVSWNIPVLATEGLKTVQLQQEQLEIVDQWSTRINPAR